MEDESVDEAIGVAIGERLRAIRRQKRWSLHDVETHSDQEFKASVLGAYERGERAVSVLRLLRLAELYGVPADQLLPSAGPSIDLTDRRDIYVGGFTIDLIALHEQDGEESRMLERFVAAVQRQRQDFNGRMLTIRESDVRLLASILGCSPGELADHLTELGLRAVRAPRPF